MESYLLLVEAGSKSSEFESENPKDAYLVKRQERLVFSVHRHKQGTEETIHLQPQLYGTKKA